MKLSVPILDKKVNNALKDLVREIKKKGKDSIQKIILYGSAARGEYRWPDSDVDLFVISDDDGLPERLLDIEVDVGLKNEVLFASVIRSRIEHEDMVAHKFSFILNVLEEGKIIYERN